MTYNQVELTNGASKLICWLELDGRVRAGTRLTLKEIPDVIWKVAAVYYKAVLHQSPRSTWKVGGLK